MISPGPKTELERLRFRVLALERLRDVATEALVEADYYLSEIECAYGDEGVPRRQPPTPGPEKDSDHADQ